MVEMGPDRLNHGIWSFIDPDHPRYEPDNPYKDSLREYYRFLDGKIGEILQHADEDTTVLVVSDHGAKAMIGGVCFNEWLVQEGYLTFEGGMPERDHPEQQAEHRLVEDHGVGRRRLLRPSVPQRRGS